MKILFRTDLDNQTEYNMAKRQLGQGMITESRTDIQAGDLVVGRYSVLPFYPELEAEITNRGATLINTHEQYTWIASMQWLSTLGELTPTTYTNTTWSAVPDAPFGWVVKGKTNSRKHQWNTHMRAPDRASLKRVMTTLNNDPLIAQQGLVVRQYMPLHTYGLSKQGMPITNEWRCFFLGQHLIAAGYYWAQSNHAPTTNTLPDTAREVAINAAKKLASHVPFFVVDVAEVVEHPGSKAHQRWTVIEVNSAQMSGLTTIDPTHFYAQLQHHVKHNATPAQP